FAALRHALLHERGLGGAGQRLAVLADRLAVAAVLRKSRARREAGERGNQKQFPHRTISCEKQTLRMGAANLGAIKLPRRALQRILRSSAHGRSVTPPAPPTG